jgi:tRNA(Glu) U13 pseudouridine synthase TruD
MSSRGETRECLVRFKDFEVLEFDKDEKTIRLRFCLPPGSYATVLLREIIK